MRNRRSQHTPSPAFFVATGTARKDISNSTVVPPTSPEVSVLENWIWANTVVKAGSVVGLGLMMFLLVEVSAMFWIMK